MLDVTIERISETTENVHVQSSSSDLLASKYPGKIVPKNNKGRSGLMMKFYRHII